MADPFLWLTAAAVATTKIRLGFNICFVPQRHPIHLAKQLACLDRISGGRVSFGAGAGWIEEEAIVMGFAIKDRWKRTMEYIRAMKALWENETAGFEGKHTSFPPIYLYPSRSSSRGCRSSSDRAAPDSTTNMRCAGLPSIATAGFPAS